MLEHSLAWVLASDNAGKIAELSALLAPLTLLPQSEFGIVTPAETGLTFVENALLKARYASAKSQRPALADDSGLVVQALQGAPGLRSARYAFEGASDEENLLLLLRNLSEVAAQDRSAFFYCTIVALRHAEDPMPLIATGVLAGSITEAPLGSHGFGYDPVFFVKEEGCTLAQLSSQEKNRISHRAKALEQLRRQWPYYSSTRPL